MTKKRIGRIAGIAGESDGNVSESSQNLFLTLQQQDEVLHSLDANAPSPCGLPSTSGAQNFFETLRQHTIAGFLIDPDYGGNDSGAGWKVIGREREHMFQAPFVSTTRIIQAGNPCRKRQTRNDG